MNFKLGYEHLSVNDIMNAIYSNIFVLPAFQRDVAWHNEKKIVEFFDSIYKGYPINPIIILEADEDVRDITRLYQFNKEESIDKVFSNKYVSNDIFGELYAVLDGQQRLTALYRGLALSFDKKAVFFDALAELVSDEDTKDEEIDKIATDKSYFYLKRMPDGKKDDYFGVNFEENKLYIPLKEIRKSKNFDELISEWTDYNIGFFERLKDRKKVKGKKEKLEFAKKYRELVENNRAEIKKRLEKVKELFTTSEIIGYNNIKLDDTLCVPKATQLLSLFIRLNTGGEQLKPADLLYSQMASNFDNSEDLRSTIGEYIEKINVSGTPNGFGFSKDNFMRALWLIFGNSSFKSFFVSGEVKRVGKGELNGVKVAIIKAVEYYKASGLGFKNKISCNMLLPIAYYLYYADKITNDQIKRDTTIEMAKFYSVASLSGYFSGQSDTALLNVKKALNYKESEKKFAVFSSVGDKFSFSALQKALNKDAGARKKKLQITEKEIDELTSYTYFEKENAKRVLLFVARSLNSAMVYIDSLNVDHIHPKKYAEEYKSLNGDDTSDEKIEEYINKNDLKISVEDFRFYLETYNNLPNLQALGEIMNKEKNASAFVEWFKAEYPSEEKRKSYAIEQAIVADGKELDYKALEFKNYKSFYQNRLSILKSTLGSVFGK